MADSTPISPRRAEAAARRAFTVVELLVATTLSGFILAGVLSANLHLLRSSVRVTQYSEMDTQVRRAFEQLAVDLKAASAFTYNSASDITVTVAESDGTNVQVTYAWNSTTGIFYRVPGASSAATTGRTTLATGITALAFSRVNTAGSTAASDSATKRLKISLTATRSGTAGARATSTAANTYTLRNKPAT